MLKGYIVTMDVVSCQTDIAGKIVAKGGDYDLAEKVERAHFIGVGGNAQQWASVLNNLANR